MAISKPVRPALIVSGLVAAVNPRRAYDSDTRRYTDEVTGYEVLVVQENGAQVSVRFGLDDVTPDVARQAAFICDVNESREYGASLMFTRNVLTDDLDRINSALSVVK